MFIRGLPGIKYATALNQDSKKGPTFHFADEET